MCNGEKNLKMATLREHSLSGGLLLVCMGQFQSSVKIICCRPHTSPRQ